MTHYGSKKGVNNGLSCDEFSGTFAPPLASGSGSTCIIHCLFTLMRNLPTQKYHSVLYGTVHSPMHNLGMTNVCACSCFYPGHRGYCKVKYGVHVKNKAATVLAI